MLSSGQCVCQAALFLWYYPGGAYTLRMALGTIRPKRSLVHQNTAQDVNGRIGYHFIWLQSTCKADVGCGALPAFHLKEPVNPGEIASSFGIGILGIMILLILMAYIVRTLRAP